MRYLLLIPLIPASIAATSWLWMLFVGVVHGEWLPMMPTVTYWQSVLIVLMSSALVGFRSVAKGVFEALYGKES